MGQESAGKRRLALGEWYREGSKSLTQLSLKKKITKKPVCSVVLFGSILNSTLGGRRVKEKEEKKKERRRKKSFLLQIKHRRY